MDKEHVAIMRLQDAARLSEAMYEKPLIVTTSGGKDSSVCVELARRAGINFEVVHNHTTVDAPETVYFVRSEMARLEGIGTPCKILYPYYKGERTSMWKLIPQKLMPPTRVVRYCCKILKEDGEYTQNRYFTTGVRWAESTQRKSRGINETIAAKKQGERIVLMNDNDDKRQLSEACLQRKTVVCNPIIDWTDADVWSFIKDSKISINPLYKCGYARVGCIGCPMASTQARKNEFGRYPKYKMAYLNAFDRMLAEREKRGLDRRFRDVEDVFRWWIEDDVLPGQMTFEDMEADDGRD